MAKIPDNIDKNFLTEVTGDYGQKNLASLLFTCKLKPIEISELYGKKEDGSPKIPLHVIYNDMHRWGFTKKFVKGISVTDLLEEKIKQYQAIIKKYTTSNRANYRKVEELLKIKERIIKAIDKYSGKEGVSEDYAEVLKEIKDQVAENDLSLATIIKLQQKDEELVRDYHKLEQDAATRLINAREREKIEEISEMALISAHETLKALDYEHDTKFAEFFYINVMKKSKEITGGTILDKTFDPEEVYKELETIRTVRKERGRKIAGKISKIISEHASKAKELIAEFGVHYQVASVAVKLMKQRPMLEAKQAIQIAIPEVRERFPYINEEGKHDKDFKKNKKQNNNGEV